jgi:hypothetical protein
LKWAILGTGLMCNKVGFLERNMDDEEIENINKKVKPKFLDMYGTPNGLTFRQNIYLIITTIILGFFLVLSGIIPLESPKRKEAIIVPNIQIKDGD